VADEGHLRLASRQALEPAYGTSQEACRHIGRRFDGHPSAYIISVSFISGMMTGLSLSALYWDRNGQDRPGLTTGTIRVTTVGLRRKGLVQLRVS